MAAAEKRLKYRRTMFWVTHDILLKLHPGQKLGDAVARASVVPVRPIQHEGIKNTLRIIAASEGDEGGEFIARGAETWGFHESQSYPNMYCFLAWRERIESTHKTHHVGT